MTSQSKLLTRFLRQPKDFTYQELKRLLNSFAYKEETKGKTSGSRVKFFNLEKEHAILIHRPHPGNILRGYVMKYVLEELKILGFIDNKKDK